jgi:hypothetical protein
MLVGCCVCCVCCVLCVVFGGCVIVCVLRHLATINVFERNTTLCTTRGKYVVFYIRYLQRNTKKRVGVRARPRSTYASAPSEGSFGVWVRTSTMTGLTAGRD